MVTLPSFFANLRRPLLIIITFSLLPIWASANTCQDTFAAEQPQTTQPAPRSISYFLNLVRNAQSRISRDPRFINPAEESALVPLWAGTQEAPLAIRDTLLNNTALIDFPLLSADAGVIKIAQPGNFTSFRLRQLWRGRDMSTNVGLPIEAILSRSLRGENKLVPSNAKAVFIFMHGGGTKTTGHHVAAAISNFMAQYGVVVLSIDAPYHAYGPRIPDLHPLEYYKYLVDFRYKFIPDNVPTFIGGHSMGGLHADNLMRLSDRQEFGIRRAFAGAINLSGPLDNAPGESIRRKNEAEEAINLNEEIMSLVPAAEQDLSVLLLTQGKTSALSGVSAQTFMGLIDWVFPQHGGRDYLPTLAIMGERDGLYVGRESIFDRFVTQLENTYTHLIGRRVNFKDKEDWVAHMIFDHYLTDGTKRPEVFTLIKEFIETQIGQSLDDLGHHPLLQPLQAADVGLLLKLVQEYYNNLAFRHFAAEYEIIEKNGTSLMAEVGQTTAEKSAELRALRGQIKNLSKQSPGDPEIDVLNERVAEIEEYLGMLRSYQQSQYIPPHGELRSFAQQNIQRRNELDRRIESYTKAKKEINKTLGQLRSDLTRTQNRVEAAVNDEFHTPTLESPEIEQARAIYEEALQDMIDLQIRMNEANSELVTSNIENGRFDINPSPELIQVYEQLDQAYSEYNATERALKTLIEQELIHSEAPEHAETRAAIIRLYGSPEAFLLDAPTADSLIGISTARLSEIERLEMEFSRDNQESNDLLVEYIERVTPEYYTVRRLRIASELERHLKDLKGNTSSMEKIWKVWTEIWKERPPEQGTSLY